MITLKNRHSTVTIDQTALDIFEYLIECHQLGKPKPMYKEIMSHLGLTGGINKLCRPLRRLEEMGLLEREDRTCWHLFPEKMK